MVRERLLAAAERQSPNAPVARLLTTALAPQATSYGATSYQPQALGDRLSVKVYP